MMPMSPLSGWDLLHLAGGILAGLGVGVLIAYVRYRR